MTSLKGMIQTRIAIFFSMETREFKEKKIRSLESWQRETVCVCVSQYECYSMDLWKRKIVHILVLTCIQWISLLLLLLLLNRFTSRFHRYWCSSYMWTIYWNGIFAKRNFFSSINKVTKSTNDNIASFLLESLSSIRCAYWNYFVLQKSLAANCVECVTKM